MIFRQTFCPLLHRLSNSQEPFPQLQRVRNCALVTQTYTPDTQKAGSDAAGIRIAPMLCFVYHLPRRKFLLLYSSGHSRLPSQAVVYVTCSSSSQSQLNTCTTCNISRLIFTKSCIYLDLLWFVKIAPPIEVHDTQVRVSGSRGLKTKQASKHGGR